MDFLLAELMFETRGERFPLINTMVLGVVGRSQIGIKSELAMMLNDTTIMHIRFTSGINYGGVERDISG